MLLCCLSCLYLRVSRGALAWDILFFYHYHQLTGPEQLRNILTALSCLLCLFVTMLFKEPYRYFTAMKSGIYHERFLLILVKEQFRIGDCQKSNIIFSFSSVKASSHKSCRNIYQSCETKANICSHFPHLFLSYFFFCNVWL